MESLWPRLAELPLVVESCEYDRLAALFHADAPNDVAPSAYNQDHPTGELPSSPLAPRPDAVGFRWTT